MRVSVESNKGFQGAKSLDYLELEEVGGKDWKI